MYLLRYHLKAVIDLFPSRSGLFNLLATLKGGTGDINFWRREQIVNAEFSPDFGRSIMKASSRLIQNLFQAEIIKANETTIA